MSVGLSVRFQKALAVANTVENASNVAMELWLSTRSSGQTAVGSATVAVLSQ